METDKNTETASKKKSGDCLQLSLPLANRMKLYSATIIKPWFILKFEYQYKSIQLKSAIRNTVFCVIYCFLFIPIL